MSPVEYLLGFISIIVGIAVADIAHSLHRLLRAGKRVRWHWFPLAASFLLILLILEIWWGLAYFERVQARVTVGMFLPWVLELILLYLVASAALPDEVPDAGIDLKSYYFDGRRYFWILLALLLLAFVIHRVGNMWLSAGVESLPRVLRAVLPNLVLVGLAISLAYVRKTWWHTLWLVLIPIAMLISVFNRPLM